MTLNELVEKLNWLIDDGLDGKSIILDIRQIQDYIQITFNNGTIGQVDEHSSIWKKKNE